MRGYREGVGGSVERRGRSGRRLLGIGASCAALVSGTSMLVSCAKLLDIPDNPVLIDEPASPAAAESNVHTQVPDDSRQAASEAVAPAVQEGEAVPTPSLTSEDSPPILVSLPDDGAFDAGPDDAERVTDAAVDSGTAPPDEAQTPCAGRRLFGICWYLGAAGESCEQACSAHGGYDEAATPRTGIRAQGGSPLECTLILGVLGSNTPARTALRLDGVGVGCHTFGADQDPYWLTLPSFDPSARLRLARIACGCME